MEGIYISTDIICENNGINNTKSGKVVGLSNKKYDRNKWKKIMDTTQLNYANMIKRLTRKSKFSDFILIYYSIFLIITTLTSKYFGEYYNSTLSEFFSIILSVVMLVYSIINSNANYPVRIHVLENALNELKNLKRKLSDDNINECVRKYNEITDKTERREDRDFFNTVKSLAKLHNVSIYTKKVKKGCSDYDEDKVEVVKDYLSEIKVFGEISRTILENLWYAIIVLIPIIVFALCIVVNAKFL